MVRALARPRCILSRKRDGGVAPKPERQAFRTFPQSIFTKKKQTRPWLFLGSNTPAGGIQHPQSKPEYADKALPIRIFRKPVRRSRPAGLRPAMVGMQRGAKDMVGAVDHMPGPPHDQRVGRMGDMQVLIGVIQRVQEVQHAV